MNKQERRALPPAYVVNTCFLCFRRFERTSGFLYHMRMAHGIEYATRGVGYNRPKADSLFKYV